MYEDISEVKTIETVAGNDKAVNDLLREGWKVLTVTVVPCPLVSLVVYVLGKK